jgi:hypothetical protein
MMHHLLRVCIFLVMVLGFGCKRDMDHLNHLNTSDLPGASKSGFSNTTMASGTCIEDADDGLGYDTILKPTILGYHLVNHPYSLANMQQAYMNLYGTSSGVAITHKYVRFKPASPQELSVLEDLNINLSDYPLDYDIVQLGDYYSDGSVGAETIPWLYAVVDVNFLPPAGIAYEVLEQIHVPVYAQVENEAFALTGNPVDDTTCTSGGTSANSSSVASTGCFQRVCPNGYVWDATSCSCVPKPCPPGTHWDGFTCVANGLPPVTPTRQPSGTIRVFDNNQATAGYRGVRNAKVIARRFLKVERVYTDNQGQFFLTKEFNKVHLEIEFENDQAKIRALRRARLWQMLFPVKRTIGKFSGTLINLLHDIPFVSDGRTDGARHWAAATANNNVQEFRDYAVAQGIGNPPDKLRILLTNWVLQGSGGATPMYAKRAWQDLPQEFITTFIISQGSPIAGGIAALIFVLKSEIDITAGYNSLGDYTGGSNLLSETLFHELGHASHYNKVGNAWWQNFVQAEIQEIVAGPAPYGTAHSSNAPIIGLGESWGYHIGHFMADMKYGANSDRTTEQGISYQRGGAIVEPGAPVVNTGLNPHLNLLEDFSPARTADPFYWIPQGLFYDLMDNRDDQAFGRVLLADNVLNYTNHQFFNSLDPDVSTLQDYRVRLLSENGNSQAAGVNVIFGFYGY